jgi:hypothetical protein
VTAPQFPAAWGQPPAPVSQAPGYPPQQQAPAQYAPQPYAPPMAPPQGYQYPPQPLPTPAPGYSFPPPAPGYGPPPQYDPYAQGPPQPPAFQPAPGTLDEYMNQRPAGAQFWKFPQPGHVNIGMVERDLRDSDVTQVQFNGQPVRRKDGSVSQEKSLSVPLVNPDGTKSVMEFRGHQRTAFEEAVSAGSGGARRLPEGGSMIRGEFTHTEASRGGGSPKKIIRWTYVPKDQVQAQPNGQAPAPQQQAPQDLQYATPVPGAQQYAQPAMQSPPAAPQQWQGNPIADPNTGQWGPPPPVQQQYAQPSNPDPAYAAWLASQGQAPQQAAPAQQFAAPTAPAAQPQAQPAPAPSPNPAGPPPPQQYTAPGLDPAASQMFAGLLGGAPAQ